MSRCLLPLLAAALLIGPTLARAEEPPQEAPADAPQQAPGAVHLRVRPLQSGLVLQVLQGDRFQTVCTPPCAADVPSGALLRVAGQRSVVPKLFLLKVPAGRQAEAVVSRSRAAALAYTVVGAALLLSGGAVAIASKAITDDSGRIAAAAGGAGVAAIGLGLGIYGVFQVGRPRAVLVRLRELGPPAP